MFIYSVYSDGKLEYSEQIRMINYFTIHNSENKETLRKEFMFRI